MTQEEKELLLKDLSARLPYGIIVDYKENEFETPHWKITNIHPETFSGWIGYDKRVGAGSESGGKPFNIEDIKPYLRPMSSMTKEEKEKYYNLLMSINDGCENTDYMPYSCMEYVDWLNAHHFDYRGLISMGLALEALEGMYKFD